jgi:hypothetical protein
MPLFRTHKQLPAFQQITHARKSTPVLATWVICWWR